MYSAGGLHERGWEPLALTHEGNGWTEKHTERIRKSEF